MCSKFPNSPPRRKRRGRLLLIFAKHNINAANPRPFLALESGFVKSGLIRVFPHYGKVVAFCMVFTDRALSTIGRKGKPRPARGAPDRGLAVESADDSADVDGVGFDRRGRFDHAVGDQIVREAAIAGHVDRRRRRAKRGRVSRQARLFNSSLCPDTPRRRPSSFPRGD